MGKKIIFYGLPLLVLSFIIAYFFLKFHYTSVTADELSYVYETNKELADEEYTNKNVKVTGKVKAYYSLMGTRNVLEFSTGAAMPVFCFFPNTELEFQASQLRENQEITVAGKCVGYDAYNFVSGVKIDVEEIDE